MTLQTLTADIPATVLTTQGMSAMLRQAVPTGAAGPTGEDTSRWNTRNWKNHDERREKALGRIVEGNYISPAMGETFSEGLHRLVMVNGSYTHQAKERLLGEFSKRLPQFTLPTPEARGAIEGPRA